MYLSIETEPTAQKRSALLLLHCADWAASHDQWVLSPHITLGNFADSRYEQLYHRLCAERGLDDGEPLWHGAYALIDVREDEVYALSRENPDSVVEQVANVIALVAARALSFSRQIVSTDGFCAELKTEELHVALGGQEEFLQDHPLVFTDQRLLRLTQAWATVETLRSREGGQRLAGALGYFYQAWRAHALDETCLHLGALLEALFAPTGTLGTPAEITRAAVRCAGGTDAERARLSRLLESFYVVRSDLVYVPCRDAAIEITTEVFHEVAHLLARILTMRELATVFSSEMGRARWLAEETNWRPPLVMR